MRARRLRVQIREATPGWPYLLVSLVAMVLQG
jgi:hypothetical protein